MWFYLLCVLLFLLAWLLLFHQKRSADLGGPYGLPYFGHLLQLDPKKPHFTLTSWAKEYGGIYKIKILGKEIVVVNSEPQIRQVLVTKSDDFAGRPYLYRFQYIAEDEIFFASQSPRWSLLKKHCMTGLKLVGDGVKRLELIASDLVDRMVKTMKEKNGEPFNPKPLLHETVSNINATLAFGWELSQDEEKQLLYYDKNIVTIGAASTSGLLLDTFPWLRYFPGLSKTFADMKKLKSVFNKVFGAALQKTINVTNEGGNCESALHDVIKLSQKSNEMSDITDETLKGIAADLIVAGNVTTSTFLAGFIAVMAKNKDLQKRCQDKVEKILKNKNPTLADRALLPLIESLILELLRLFSHVVLLIPHMTLKDTEVDGYFIPKDTEVWVNTWYLHHDPTLWVDPWTVKPERFLDEEGKLLPPDHANRKRLFPFGAGRRVCVGEALARNRLFLFVCTLLQKFTFLPEEEGADVPSDPRTWIFGSMCAPEDFKIRAIIRN